MKEKRWIFFRITVYLGLVGAATGLSILFYSTFMRYGHLKVVSFVSIIIGAGLLSQMVFHILNMWLIHHHLFNKLLPGTTFSICHTVLLVINSCVGIALLCIFLYGCAETFKTKPYHNPHTEDVIALSLIGIYTFITIGTVTGSLVLRRYIKYATSVEEDEWLNRMGT